jgi:SAM-dependent methyltransferase
MAHRPWYFNASRKRLRAVVARFAKATPPGALVLDAGAGPGMYRRLFDHATYEAADFAQLPSRYTPLDYVCDLTAIPVEDGRFDRIVCTQVFEHLPEPDRAAAELFRVMRPGGRLLLTAPFMFHEHQKPYDFYRYTRYGMRAVVERAGFEVERIARLEGYFGTLSYQFDRMYHALPRNPLRLEKGWRLVYLAPLLLGTRQLANLLRGAFARAELRWRLPGGDPKNYVVLATRPDAAAPGPAD